MNLSHHFLLAMPSLDNDSVFHQSVVYLCEYGESGALGLIVNKPSPVNMEIVFAAIGKPTPEKLQGQFVMMGGPVQPERGFVLHTPTGEWESSLHIIFNRWRGIRPSIRHWARRHRFSFCRCAGRFHN